VLKVGQQVEVYVVGIDRENRKIALSLKRLQEEPWAQVSNKYQVGQLVGGKITKLATFGAFAEIEPGVEGLIHISELSDERISHPKQVVQEGEQLRLRVIKVDPTRRRLGLSLRQVDYQEDLEQEEREPGAPDQSSMLDGPGAGSSFESAEPGDTEERIAPREMDLADQDLRQEAPERPGNGEAGAFPERRQAGIAEA
jgi:small subunit ribosomal protein S1